jgi:cytoskeleton protein RodZ
MKELGEYLSSERVKRGLSPEDLARKASISVKVLRSVEDGSLDWVGTPILIRGFIRNYCTALGLDSAPLLEQYSKAIRSFDQQGKGIQRYKTWLTAYRGKKRVGVLSLAVLCILAVMVLYAALWVSDRHGRLLNSPQTGKDAYPQEELPSDLSKRFVQPAPAAGRADSSSASRGMAPEERSSGTAQKPEGVHAGASVGSTTAPASDRGVRPPEERSPGMAQKPEATHAAASAGGTTPPALDRGAGASEERFAGTTQKPEDVRAGVSVSAAAPSLHEHPNQEGGRPAISSPAPQKHTFTVEAVRGAWLQVSVDGKAGKGMTLKPGKQRTWEAEKSVEIVLGNAPGVRMTWDDRPVQIPDRQNKVLRFSLPDSRYLPGE